MFADPDDLDDDDDGLATQRTGLAWQRTGLTHMATGTLMLRLLPSSPYRLALCLAMIVLGALISVGARRMRPDRPHRRSIALVGATTALIAAAASALSFG